jgi:hypothetical protein
VPDFCLLCGVFDILCTGTCHVVNWHSLGITHKKANKRLLTYFKPRKRGLKRESQAFAQGEGMKRIRPSIIGMTVAVVVTALAAASWAVGFGGILGIVLLPGGLLEWAFVYGDNIRSPDEVMGMITLISLVVNAIDFA